ncbi:MAG TPA: AAA family ATPase [Vicinamibacterales bacterium]|jgi:transitional endoplasmic reticulum ATPase|nr:AAA family ATPase [Vicinamibacterales bacterium]
MPRLMPDWAEDLRRRYLRGESSMFVLHGNVYDAIVDDEKLVTLTDFITDVLLKDTRETIAVFNVATGVRFTKRAAAAGNLDDLLLASGKERALGALERLLVQSTRSAVVVEYAEAVAPTGDPAFQADADRAAIITLHRWSFLAEIERGDNLVILIAENLPDLAPKLVSNPKVAIIDIPMPDEATRRAVVRLSDKRLSDAEVDRYADLTAGLKALQIASIVAPPPAAEEDALARERFIVNLLGAGPDVADRAHKLATLTSGMNHDDIRRLVAPTAVLPATIDADRVDQARSEIDRLIAQRKREILERECFGLVEFVEPAHGFEVVGGMEEVKKDLLVIADSIREGRTFRVPMGLLFTGPMGTGKTFVAEAFAKECRLPTIKLKNFRSKWVGATEGNLERILTVIRAIGQVVVIIDEGDRAFGSGDGESDGGTSSRVIARIKEFMSDTSNRGRILFLVMTNRPDKLDVDLKRAGRLDRKIPFLYSQTPEEVEQVAAALIRKNHISTSVDLASIRTEFSSKLVGYSNADVEAVLLMANDDAARAAGGDAPVTQEHLTRAASDYFPSRDAELLEYMELLAVFEASSRRLLPPKYASMQPEELDERLRHLRVIVGNRR